MSEVKVMTVKIGDVDRTVEVRKPTPKIEAEANMASSKVFAKLIKEKDEDGKPAYILRSQLNSYLANIGIYSDQDIDDINTFGDRIKELEALLSKGGKKKSEGRAAAIELRRMRYAIYVLLIRQNDFDKNTVEHYADNAKMNYLVSKCICFEGGAPVFKSVDDYESDSILQKALDEPIRTLAGMVSSYDPDFEKNMPENKFLKKYGFCDDKYRLIDAEGNLIDGDGNRVDGEGNTLAPVEVVESVGEFLDDGPSADEVSEVGQLESPAEEEVKTEVVVDNSAILESLPDNTVLLTGPADSVDPAS